MALTYHPSRTQTPCGWHSSYWRSSRMLGLTRTADPTAFNEEKDVVEAELWSADSEAGQRSASSSSRSQYCLQM